MVNVWNMAIDKAGYKDKEDGKTYKYVSYEEIKHRCVVAGGWSSTGDLSYLYHSTDSKINEFIDNNENNELKFSNTFNRILRLDGIAIGDIVLGFEGRTVRGICEILDASSYFYMHDESKGEDIEEFFKTDIDKRLQFERNNDKFFEYANTLYPVFWVNIVNVLDAKNLSVSRVGPRGIESHNNNPDYVRSMWLDYKLKIGKPLPWASDGEWLKQRLSNLDKLRKRRMTEKFQKPLEHMKQIILHGSPGTGKTYTAFQIIEDSLGSNYKQMRISNENPNGQWDFVQFHPSYNYEDFVRGIKSETNGSSIEYKEVNKVFANMCKEANKIENKDKKYYLIIDEINRANVATVLGELLYALEYRGESVTTTYADELGNRTLTVPNNLYIIGTMNTSDRSIGHIDYAVRRRFAFIPCLPDRTVIDATNQGEVKVTALKFFDLVAELFNTTLSNDYRKEDVQIGHTYFLAKNAEELQVKMQHQVAPLLKEYLRDGILTNKSDVESVISKICAE
ncbi:MAG: AAA family ATPase [Candidatus Pacebacteria bacterium]|nr:AAA family ATPase [Candidatus Paceibacterota bacterium]